MDSDSVFVFEPLKLELPPCCGGRPQRKADTGGDSNYARSATYRGDARSPSEDPAAVFFPISAHKSEEAEAAQNVKRQT
ncbi:MAG: hypothetical protein E2O79_04880 [Caldithrix sp.]|nr:MAG: hypothetical protein E2O79_04880 [Caldithrix sp.]